MKYVHPFTTAAATEVTQAGGKGAMLARLWQAGLPVPPGCVLAPSALTAYVQIQGQRVPATADEAHRVLRAGAPPDAMQEELQTVLAQFKPVPCGWAVRSSAVAEDSARASYAGIFESFLEIQDD
ncbi:MAG: PEP/pyruvate-binding domain-containing protein, partial [Candidatus Tectomicrobia bacterium]